MPIKPRTIDSPVKEAQPSTESVEIRSDQLNDPEIELTMTNTVSDVDDVVFSAIKGIRRYQIVRAPQEKIDDWKRGVDEIISAIAARDFHQVENLMKKGST